jgi:redox-sensitive bicupin YhaK (pirin superfamily)
MTQTTQPQVDIRLARSRFATTTDWLESYHSFSFADHYDPENTHHGLLLVSNDDVIKPGSGFMTHPHRDMEIVTWVLEGELEHKDTLGNRGIIYPGLAQRMSAGSGIWHSEINPSATKPVRLVQMWMLPDTLRVTPGYEQMEIQTDLDRGGLVPIASGRGHDSAIRIHQQHAVLWVARLRAGEGVNVPDNRMVHVFVATGAVELEGAGFLTKGDAARLTAAGDRRLTANPTTGAEVLLWEMG